MVELIWSLGLHVAQIGLPRKIRRQVAIGQETACPLAHLTPARKGSAGLEKGQPRGVSDEVGSQLVTLIAVLNLGFGSRAAWASLKQNKLCILSIPLEDF